MKRSFVWLVVLVAALALSAVGHAQEQTFESYYTTVAPVIDGNLDGPWENAKPHITNRVGPTIVGTWKSLWTEDALYLAFSVMGPGAILLDADPTQPWRSNSIEFALGTPNRWKVFVYIHNGRQVADQPGVESVVKQVDGGWVAEFKIDADAVSGLKLEEGAEGLWVGARANVFFWGERNYMDVPTEGLLPNSPSTYAKLALVKP